MRVVDFDCRHSVFERVGAVYGGGEVLGKSERWKWIQGSVNLWVVCRFAEDACGDG